MAKKFSIFTLKNNVSDKSSLTPLELKNYIDFEIKRVYFISNIKTSIGGHCHLEEKELFVMLKGSCTAVIDQGNGREEFTLEGSKHAMYVANFIWHGFKNFSDHAVILALSSTNYKPDRSDYIENYEEYLKIRDEKLKQ